ncbi:unnamed protein product, partial [Polarella glacialis]
KPLDNTASPNNNNNNSNNNNNNNNINNMVASVAPPVGRQSVCDGSRRLFERPGDRGRLLEDSVLLRIEAQLPPGSPTAVELMNWGSMAGRSEQVQAEFASLAASCRELVRYWLELDSEDKAVLEDGRGARVVLQEKAKAAPVGGECCAIVSLKDGSTCHVYADSSPTTDGSLAVLQMPAGNEVSEIRYRSDESVVVLHSDGKLFVRRPRLGDRLHQAHDGAWRVEAAPMGNERM